MRGNEAHAWDSWRTERNRHQVRAYLISRPIDHLAKLAEDAQTFAAVVDEIRDELISAAVPEIGGRRDALSVACQMFEAGREVDALTVMADHELGYKEVVAEMAKRGRR